MQGLERFRGGGVQLAKVTQQGQVPEDSVMRLPESKAGGGERGPRDHPSPGILYTHVHLGTPMPFL